MNKKKCAIVKTPSQKLDSWTTKKRNDPSISAFNMPFFPSSTDAMSGVPSLKRKNHTLKDDPIEDDTPPCSGSVSKFKASENKKIGGSKKSAVKHILRDLYPEDYLRELPNNILLGIEDGSHCIHTVPSDFKGNIITMESIKSKILAAAEYMFGETDLTVYAIFFDNPELVPPNKSAEQRSRRDGKDEQLDAIGCPRIQWDGKGPYMYRKTPLVAWKRMRAHSGTHAFRQALSDLFLEIMATYRPPPGKTLLMSGMFTHLKKGGELKTCRKIYALRTPFHIATNPNSQNEEGIENINDTEDFDCFPTTGVIPRLEEMTQDDILDAIPGQFEKSREIVRSTYHARIKAHVKKYRDCMPNYRVMAGEADISMFHFAQFVMGNTTFAGPKCTEEDEKEAHAWIDSRIFKYTAMESFSDVPRPVYFGTNKESKAPGIIIRSADTDMISIALAGANLMEKGKKKTGWERLSNNKLSWLAPRFSWWLYLDFLGAEITETEYFRSLGGKDKLIAAHQSVSTQQSTQDDFFPLTMELDLSNRDNDDNQDKSSKSQKKFNVEELVNVNSIYSRLMKDLNPDPSDRNLDHRIACNTNGFLIHSIYSFLAAVKIAGDDYVQPPLYGVQMKWFVDYLFKDPYANSCVKFDPSYKQNPAAITPCAKELLNMDLDPTEYLALTKGALLSCYSQGRTRYFDPNMTPSNTTLFHIDGVLKKKRQNSPYYWIPQAPYYGPKAQRLLWALIYIGLGQLDPTQVPNGLLMGWKKNEDGHVVIRMDPESYHPEVTKKREQDANKKKEKQKTKNNTVSWTTKRRKLTSSNPQEKDPLGSSTRFAGISQFKPFIIVEDSY